MHLCSRVAREAPQRHLPWLTVRSYRRMHRPNIATVRSHSSISPSQASHTNAILVQKPNIPFRRREQHRRVASSLVLPPHKVFLAFGSNLGDRLLQIEDAITVVDREDGIRVVRTSGLWETAPMYVTDQAPFLNGVCEIETSLEPLALLDVLQSIEKTFHRRKTVDKGPRTVDLDILLYDEIVFEDARLCIPHKLMLERAFVLQPLYELDRSARILRSDGQYMTCADALAKLNKTDLAPSTMTPINGRIPPLKAMLPDRDTHLMSILNVTPDSFSDGGIHSTTDASAVEETIQSHIGSGVSIIDVGGQSTRPNADEVEQAEEIKRVVPVIELIRAMRSEKGVESKFCISIDTYRAPVARAGVKAGADIVNDVSAGVLDPDMLSTVAELSCPVILMHMRGTPTTMTSKENTSYPKGLINTIGAELCARVRAAEAAGVRRWRILLDPGIGFAKTGEQNLEILSRFSELRAYPGLEGIPWVVGTSRKGFIGKITGVKEPRERTWGTAAAVTAAVRGGADVVRVHDASEMSQVVKMADAIWRK